MIEHIFDTARGDTLLIVPQPIAGGTPQLLGIGNLVGSGDPGVGFDSTQGYSVGSVYFNANPGQLRWWDCRDATPGAAKWNFGGADYANGGTNPAIEQTQFGSGADLMKEEGNTYREVLSPAGRNPGGTAVDSVIAVYTMSLNSFDAAGRGVNLLAEGAVANNTNVKRIKMFWGCTAAVLGSPVSGGTLIADTGNYSTALAAGWSLEANVFKYGANGSNTQLALHMSAQIGATVGPLLPPAGLTAPENAPIIIAVTGNAATAATDITQNFFEVNAMN